MKIRSWLLPEVPPIPAKFRMRVKADEWTLSQERQFMEDLVYKRMTLFLAIAAALVAGAINLRDDFAWSIPLLAGGTLLCAVLQQTVSRAQRKLEIILTILFARDDHPTGYINTILDDHSRAKWVGHLVPLVITVLLALATLTEIAIAVSRAI